MFNSIDMDYSVIILKLMSNIAFKKLVMKLFTKLILRVPVNAIIVYY